MAEKPAKKEPRIDRDTLVMWRENIQDAYAELDQTLATLIETFGGKRAAARFSPPAQSALWPVPAAVRGVYRF